MLKVSESTRYKKDKKKLKGKLILQKELIKVTKLLKKGIPLQIKYCDHKLRGKFEGYRECHIAPDCLLVYKKTHTHLDLVRIESHSNLFKN